MKHAWPYSKLVAHRGGGRHAPENTLAAIRHGQSLGYRTHEIDVKLTRDGVSVLMHDATLERTTGVEGRAADLEWRELRKLDAGAWHSAAFRGEPIPTFEETAALLRSRDTMINIEIKPTPGFDRATGLQVARETRELWRGSGTVPLFSSFSYEALLAAREAAPEIPRGWLVDRFTEADWERLAVLDAAALHTNHRKFDPAWVQPLHDAGYRILLYTVNDADRVAELLAAGVDSIVTDEVEQFAVRFRSLL